jgi:hypothetical protein
MTVRGKLVKRQCQNKSCKKMFAARQADVDRGWARFCSKSCKAKAQEKSTGSYRSFRDRQELRNLGLSHHGSDDHRRGGIPQYDNSGEYVGFVFSGIIEDDF